VQALPSKPADEEVSSPPKLYVTLPEYGIPKSSTLLARKRFPRCVENMGSTDQIMGNLSPSCFFHIESLSDRFEPWMLLLPPPWTFDPEPRRRRLRKAHQSTTEMAEK
jgi:hypothetical protein